MRFLSMFSGIDAASVAWGPLGWKAAAFCEIDAFPSAVLAQHYPDTPNLGDVTKADFDGIGPIDIAVFGSPCQSFSVAGLRLGLDDARGNLALLAGSIVYRKRPRWFIFENVPGLLSSDDGFDFGTLLAAFAGYPTGYVFKPPADGWGSAGVVVQANADSYGLAWRVLDAQYFRVAQRRRRVFVVGYLGDWRRAAAVLFERHSLSGHPAPRREAGKSAPTIPSRRSAGGGLGTDFDCDGGLISTEECADTLTVGANQTTGFPSPSVVASTGHVAHCLNAGGMGRQDYESETLIAHTLKGEGFDASEDGTGRGTPLVPVCIPINADALRGEGTALTPSADATGRVRLRDPGFGVGDDGDPAGTLAAAGPGAVAVAFNMHKSGNEASSLDVSEDRTDCLRAFDKSPFAVMQPASAVRRLTPRECERLQGFPDDYTLVPHRGKPAADGPRYKALGNSMAVPVMRWIGERIQAVEDLTTKNDASTTDKG